MGKEARVIAGDGDSLSLYLKQIARYKLLTVDQELEIGKKIVDLRQELNDLTADYQKNGGCVQEYMKHSAQLEKDLREQKSRMINANLRLVVSIAKNISTVDSICLI